MKTLKTLAILGALILAMASPSFAQTTTTSTLLSTAITTLTQSTITVASATGFTAQTTAAYIDGEYMTVRAVSGTTITVARGQGGTRSALHPANSLIYVGPTGNTGPFGNIDGTVRSAAPGSCTRTDVLYLPLVNIINGNVWDCRESRWVAMNFRGADTLVPWESIDTNADYTALLTDTWINFTDLNTDRAVTLPSITGIRGKRLIITIGDNVTTPGVFAYGVNGQTFASGAVSGFKITGAGGAMRLLSTGTGWVTW